MLKSYIKIALRSLFRNRLTSFINIFGLGLSMSVGLMIIIRLQDQLSYDRFHSAPERTFRIISSYHQKNGEQWKMASTPLPLKGALNTNQNLIEACTSVYAAFNGKAFAAGKEIGINGAFTDPSFFKVFGFLLKVGNAATALQQPNTVVITKAVAEKFFGTEYPVGKIISLEKQGAFTVTGVLAESPGKSHLNFDAYASYSSIVSLEKSNALPQKTNMWFAFNAGYTYVLVKNKTASAALVNQLQSIASGLNRMNKDAVSSFDIQRLDKITPGHDDLANEISNGSSWSKIYFELGVALLILLAACFNYTNLTIARALTRAKEVGMRKIVGARRYQIFFQYVVESVLLSLFALSFAWIILSFIIRYAPFNDGYEFIPSSFEYNSALVYSSLAYALLTGLFAGVAPAWVLSAFKPLRVLKNLSTAKILGKLSLQKSLIVFQYTLSLTMIIFLFAFYKQFSFLSKTDPGFKRENVLILPMNGVDETIAGQKVLGIAGVQSVTASSAEFSKRFNGLSTPVWISNAKEASLIKYYYADNNFIPSMELKLVAGTNFPAETDNEEHYIILNERAVQALALGSPQKAVGQKLWINDSTQLQITGVLKDFQYEEAARSIDPLVFRNKRNAYSYLYLIADNRDRETLVTSVEQAWKEIQPASQPNQFLWLDEEIEKGNSQIATISLLGFLVFIAIAVASLGLLGLVVYTVEVKRKEISIRKIVGAGKKQLIQKLSKGFINLLLIAGIIAMPIGYILGMLFLQNFSQRTSFGILNLLGCFMVVFSIGLLTIISQTYKAAMANPVKNLRTE
jgi:putative ABC transport system permease protein